MAELAERVILCPVDFSDPSRRALRYAAALAARVNASLTVLYVSDPLLSTAAAAAGYDERKLASQSERELRRFVRGAIGDPASPRVAFSTALGEPHRLINRAVRDFGAGLIVMGTHGLRGARKLMLGSTTEKTLRDAAVPVLAIPHHAPKKPGRGWPAGPLVAGVDLGPEARADVEAFASLARVFGAELLLVHVTPEVTAPAWFKLRKRQDDGMSAARTRLARLASTASADEVAVSFRVARGEPALALDRIARRTKAGTLLLILRAQKGLFGMARGTVTYRVLTTGGTPVLALPGGVTAARWARAWVSPRV